MSLVSNAEFLSQLADLYTNARIDGPKSVYVTMKPYDGRMKAMPKGTGLQSTENTECLVRAKLGKKRISTSVCSKDVNAFHIDYMRVLQTNMTSLEKRKKTEEEKLKQKAKKVKA